MRNGLRYDLILDVAAYRSMQDYEPPMHFFEGGLLPEQLWLHKLIRPFNLKRQKLAQGKKETRNVTYAIPGFY
jgi:hypothetical protein